MNLLRSHLLPHAVFLVLFCGVVIGAVVILNGQLQQLRILSRAQHHLILILDPEEQSQEGRGPEHDEPSRILRIKNQLSRFQRDVTHFFNVRSFVAIGGGGESFQTSELSSAEKQLRRSWKDLYRMVGDLKEHVRWLKSDHSFRMLKDVSNKIEKIFRAQDRTANGDGLGKRLEEEDIYNLIFLFQHNLEGLQRATLQELGQTVRELGNVSRSVTQAVTYSLLLVILLSLAYFITVSTIIARPLRQLSDVARMVTAGRLLIRAKIDSGGPVAELTEDFNRMVDMLVRSLKEKEKMVEQLREKTHELAAANEHKDRFIANISHELKTPLNAVIGFSDILLLSGQDHLTEKEIDYLQRIKRAGKHLLAMICDLIDLVKLDLQALELRPEEVDIHTLMQETAQMIRVQAEAKNIEFNVKAQEQALHLRVDPVRLKQIVLNLLSNAVKFTPEGGHVNFCYELCDDTENIIAPGGKMLRIQVEDDGIGISKEDQKRIFGDFIQVDNRLHRRHEGAGIGLALTRRLVHLMHGKVGLKSELDKGSTFTVLLPVLEVTGDDCHDDTYIRCLPDKVNSELEDQDN
ncbi:MAG: sensor histidine kinase [Lentisphaerae bacterium]|nr:MAG: sensor histidine kinase [Lentisphaerota bacterium]